MQYSIDTSGSTEMQGYAPQTTFCESNGTYSVSDVLPLGGYEFDLTGNEGDSGDGASLFTIGDNNGGAGVAPGTFYNIANSHSVDCLVAGTFLDGVFPETDGTYNGNPISQHVCFYNPFNAQWQFQPTDSGYYTIQLNGSSFEGQSNPFAYDLDVQYKSVDNGSIVHLWQNYNLYNQQWIPVYIGNGLYNSMYSTQ